LSPSTFGDFNLSLSVRTCKFVWSNRSKTQL
jgi:hypothetical protein